MSKLLLNRIQTPDGTILTSRRVHEYLTHLDKNGKEYMVDGGLVYLRRTIHDDCPYKELSVWATDPFEKIRENFEWGTYGKEGNQPIKYVKLKDLSSEHIEAILDTQHHVPPEVIEIFWDELKWRRDNEWER